MEKRIFLAAVVLAVVMFGALGYLMAATTGPVQAGVAETVKGDVRAMAPSDSAAHALKSGDPVFMGDMIETGADGQLEIRLLDQTVFTLGASGAFKMDEFAYDPKTDDGMVKASMLKGIFRIVSGKVAHKKSENMVVNLPSGSLGFRGTNVAGIINGARTEIILLGPVGSGRIYVTNLVNGQVVTVDIDEAGYATIVDGPNSAPIAVFQVSEAELTTIAESLGLSMPDLTGDAQSGMFDPDALDSDVQSEESARDISSVTA